MRSCVPTIPILMVLFGGLHPSFSVRMTCRFLLPGFASRLRLYSGRFPPEEWACRFTSLLLGNTPVVQLSPYSPCRFPDLHPRAQSCSALYVLLEILGILSRLAPYAGISGAPPFFRVWRELSLIFHMCDPARLHSEPWNGDVPVSPTSL